MHARPLRCPFLLPAVALAALASATRAADLFVGPGQQFAEIHAAHAAASPGDRIYVAPGTYLAFDITKAVEIHGAGKNLVRVEGGGAGAHSRITGIAAGEVALVTGLAFEHGLPGPLNQTAVLELAGNAGTVVLQRVDVNTAPQGTVRAPGVLVADTARFLMQDCIVLGTDGQYLLGTIGWPAIEASNAALGLVDTWLLGGAAAEESPGFGAPGAAALRLVGGELRLARVTAVGGRGGYDGIVIVPYQGGPAVELDASELVLTGGPGNLLRGGKGGENSVTTAFGGPALRLAGNSTAELAADAELEGGLGGWITTEAPPLSIEAGSTATALGWNLPALAPTPPALALGAQFVLELSGEPGAFVVPFLGTQLGPPFELPGIDGVVHLSIFSYFALPLSVLDAQGLGSTPLVVPMQPGLAGAQAWFQSVEVVGPSARFSNPALVAIAP